MAVTDATATVGIVDGRMAMTADGDVLYLAAHEGVRTADLHELLTSAVVAPDEEVPYFLNRASDMLESLFRTERAGK